VMTTGDKVLALLGAKAVCCGLLVFAATGALGGLGVWLTDGAGRWLMGGAILVAIAAIVFRRRRRVQNDQSVERTLEFSVFPGLTRADCTTGPDRCGSATTSNHRTPCPTARSTEPVPQQPACRAEAREGAD